MKTKIRLGVGIIIVLTTCLLNCSNKKEDSKSNIVTKEDCHNDGKEIDSTVFSIIMSKKSPITISYPGKKGIYSPHCYIKPSQWKDQYSNWTFQLIMAYKISKIKSDLAYWDYDDKDLSRIQVFFAAYSCTVGLHDYPWFLLEDDGLLISGCHKIPYFSSVYEKIIISLRSPKTQNAVWAFISPALGHQIKTMNIRYQGVIIKTFEYVKAYFLTNYDQQKARNWYLQDAKTKQFARKDYLNNANPARKAAAFIERCMFKHKILTLGEVKRWIDVGDKWLHNLLGKNYATAKAYWK